MDERIAAVEAAGYAAWPARELALLDGWELRYANGFSRRGNSVLPLGSVPQDLDARIERCRQWYSDRDLDPVFRFTPLCDHATDQALADRGFTREGETHVMIGDLAAGGDGALLPETPTSRWWEAMAGMWGIGEDRRDAWRSIVERIDLPAAFPIVADGPTVYAAGLGVVAGEWLGLFELIVAKHHRRCGWGRELAGSLLDWGRAKEARHVFLQVVVGNDPAIGLYETLGFRELYRYWYRRAPS